MPGVKGVLTGADFPEGHNLGNPEAFKELAAQLANRKPGWYAIEVEDYPFGKATRLFCIPGRHLRYIRAHGHSF